MTALAAVDPGQAREEARRILAGRRYGSGTVPRPLHGILRWIGDRLSPIGRWIGDRFSWLPGSGALWLWGTLAVALAVGVFFGVRRVRERAFPTGSGDQRVPAGGHGRDDPDALEAAAIDATAAGDDALAVRLRFRAGLIRLDRDAHAITYRASIATAAVRDTLTSERFDDLADTFEAVTYGGRDAEPADADVARRDWPVVVDSARRR